MNLPRPTLADPRNLLQGVNLLADELDRRFPDVIKIGSSTLTWPGGAAASNVLVVTHGLGLTPVVVLGQVFTSVGVAFAPYLSTINTYTRTQFSAQAVTTGAAPPNTATTTFVWVAIA